MMDGRKLDAIGKQGLAVLKYPLQDQKTQRTQKYQKEMKERRVKQAPSSNRTPNDYSTSYP